MPRRTESGRPRESNRFDGLSGRGRDLCPHSFGHLLLLLLNRACQLLRLDVTVLFAFPIPKFALRYWLVGQDPHRSLLASVQRVVSSVKRQALVARVRSILACDVRGDLDQIEVSILYVQAAQDRLVDAVCFEDIRNAKPRVVLVRISAPHLVLQREPQKAAEAILRFIQEFGAGRE